MLARISRWPVLYRTRVVIRAVLRRMEDMKFDWLELTTQALTNKEVQTAALLLLTLLKLFEFRNSFTEAFQVSPIGFQKSVIDSIRCEHRPITELLCIV